MDRKMVIQLLQDGMYYPIGTHRVWISRCFEITVRPDEMVELDEYEGFTEEKGVRLRERPLAGIKDADKMFHVGRSILNLKDKKVTEKAGAGWKKSG